MAQDNMHRNPGSLYARFSTANGGIDGDARIYNTISFL